MQMISKLKEGNLLGILSMPSGMFSSLSQPFHIGCFSTGLRSIGSVLLVALVFVTRHSETAAQPLECRHRQVVYL